MAVRFVVVPQWQGSGSARAMQLVDGAAAIREDLPNASTTDIDVPLEAGDAEGTGIQRFSSLRVVRQRLAQALDASDQPAITIGGDCGVDYGSISHAAARGRIALVWFDAHADANTVESSPSKAFHGMVVRALVDDGVIDAGSLILAGTREWDPAEAEWIAAEGINTIDVDALRDPANLVAAVEATGATSVYLHVDLDVLDPAEIAGISFPEPFGAATAELVAAIKAVRERVALAGAGITEFSPSTAGAASDDLGTVLRIIAAITAGV